MRSPNRNHRDQTAQPKAFDPVVEWRPIDALRSYSQNARTHSDKQIKQITASISEFGFVNPVLIDADGGIIAGHGRVKAAGLLGMKKAPTIRLDHLSDAQKRAYVIADNRLAELAGWDEEILAIELQNLTQLDLDFDIEITGFETPEIDLMIGAIASAEDEDPADEVPRIAEDAPPVTVPGDLWLLGEHRLVCGDALDPETYQRLMGGAEAQLIFTDPPYNVPIDGHVCGLGTITHGDFAMASGEMSKDEFTAFLATVFRNLARHSANGSIHFICMDWRHLGEVIAAGGDAYDELKNLCVWAKTNGGMGSLYRSQHELVFVFKSGTGPHINNVELGKHGRYRTNVWTYPGINSFGKDRDAALALHPTVKPVKLVVDAILDCSKRRGVVLDAFAGSGTTLIAAEQTKRRGHGIELDPRYVDVTIRRWQRLTGEEAIHAETGLTMALMADVRGKAAEPEAVAPVSSDAATGREVRHG